MEFHYVRWFPADYMRDTRRLTQCEHGAYFLLLNEYYLTGEPLPDDNRLLAKISLCDTQGDWLAIRPAIESHFEIRDGKWFHHRCDRELDKATSATAAMKRGAAMTNKKRWGSPSDTQPESPCGQQPEPELKPESKPESKTPPSISPPSGEKPTREKVLKFEIPEKIIVANYFMEIGSSKAEARKFYDHHTARGWMLGRVKMRDWQAAARGWHSNEEIFSHGLNGASPADRNHEAVRTEAMEERAQRVIRERRDVKEAVPMPTELRRKAVD